MSNTPELESKHRKSQINLLTGQLNQLVDSGLFTEVEIQRLSAPLKLKLGQLHAIENGQEPAADFDGVNNIEVRL